MMFLYCQYLAGRRKKVRGREGERRRVREGREREGDGTEEDGGGRR